jgi:hypothetical protein
MRVLVIGLPKQARDVVLTGAGLPAPTVRRGAGLFRARLTAPPAAGPLSLGVRFTLHGRRYEAQVGVVFVVPAPGVQ